MTVSEDTLYMCLECRKQSGAGQNIQVHYFSWGGYSPFIEGRRCTHIDNVDILCYVNAQIKWQEQEYQGKKFRTAERITDTERREILEQYDQGVPTAEISATYWKNTGWMLPLSTIKSVINRRP